MGCANNYDCAFGYSCQGGRCQKADGFNNDLNTKGSCLDDGNPCNNDCESAKQQRLTKDSVCGLPDDGSEDAVNCEEDGGTFADCNKFCEDYRAATGATLAGCTPNSACGACLYCSDEGICKDKVGGNRSCICPAYIDEFGKVVDDGANRDCYLCDIETGAWVLQNKICERTFNLPFVCDCPGETVTGVGSSSNPSANLYDLALKDAEYKCEQACNKTCKYGYDRTCNSLGPIPVGEDPSLNYPCPEGWTCARQSQRTLFAGADPEGGEYDPNVYYWYTCAYPGWPGVDWNDYINTEGCGCTSDGPAGCINVDHNPAAGPFVCNPGNFCVLTSEITVGDTSYESWRVCPVNNDVPDTPGCAGFGKRFYPIYKAEHPQIQYLPCTCENPQGDPVTIPANTEFFWPSTPGAWPFRLEEDAPCSGVNCCAAATTRCATRQGFICSQNPIGINPPVICIPRNEYLMLEQLCFNVVSWDYSRIWDVFDGDDDRVHTEATNVPPSDYLDTLAYGRTEAFQWQDTNNSGVYFYDLPPIPSEYVQYRNCSAKPTLVGLIDIYALRCSGTEEACTAAISGGGILFQDVVYTGNPLPTPDGIPEDDDREPSTNPPIPVATQGTISIEGTAEKPIFAGDTVGALVVDGGGGTIFAARFEGGSSITPDNFFNISSGQSNARFRVNSTVGLTNGTYSYSYQVGSQNNNGIGWSKLRDVTIVVTGIPVVP